ncbi:hypothetical protein [Thermoflexus sp.]|uniref:hypothetical protein n=2 Tax=Thermoflexus sp. TaxID=1969742 RepID=UPI0025D0F560|nr:hypothetical protein [Thermoflexus sp.]MCS6964599.1 hypothetical protein [Thermoflexus sp.]MCX7690965.1 hypothetical protein [Thermoflexus sp.]MDW8184119.1 rRNA adenine methyltransferase [Anaerolineae bacterium]
MAGSIAGRMIDDWERLWAPYDEEVYDGILARLQPGERVLEIGAGDLRLSSRMAERGCRVVAVERQWALLAEGMRARGFLPGALRWEQPLQLSEELTIVWADARTWPFPPVESAILLMRHCAAFPVYMHKLRRVGCRRLFTNARWRMGVEEIPLGPALSFEKVPLGWYACRCGAVGFREGPPELIDATVLEHVWEVENCPACERTLIEGRVS